MKRNTYLFLASIFLLTSCVSFKPYAQSELDFPLKPVTEVEVFYPGELLPYKDYIEIGSLATNMSGATNNQAYVAKLQKIARENGVDALMDLQEDQGYYGGRILTAMGIKYIKNIDYLDEYVKKESFYKLDSLGKNKELVAVIERSPVGRTLSSRFMRDEEKDFYETYIQNYRDHHLREEKDNWTYRKNVSTGMIISRQYSRSPQWVVKTLKFKYGELGLERIKIFYNDNFGEEEIFYLYDEKARVSGRQLELPFGKQLTEGYKYDSEGKLIRKIFILKIPNQAKAVQYVSEYEYYKKEDIHDFLSQE